MAAAPGKRVRTYLGALRANAVAESSNAEHTTEFAVYGESHSGGRRSVTLFGIFAIKDIEFRSRFSGCCVDLDRLNPTRAQYGVNENKNDNNKRRLQGSNRRVQQ
jgi:hypothetical protein